MEIDEELEKIKKQMLNKILNSSDTPSGVLKGGEVVNLNLNNFNDALTEADRPLLVDFWAAWCSPCRIMEPIFKELASSYLDSAFFAKVNIDENVYLAQKYGVNSIPHFLLFKSGMPVDRVIGAVGKSILESTLLRHL